ncbi:putative ABC transporter permease [Candidatus Saccharibacteria bacterium]|nr:putative ABC transporter permease [Candidatus Saccharibacteria bacterium]
MSAKPKSLAFWRNLALYYIVFSFVGHWFEIVIALLIRLFWGVSPQFGIFDNPIEPYTIYGLGAVVCVLIATFLPNKIRHNFGWLFLINTVACALVEYTSAALIVMRFGHNLYWDYSNVPFNLNGYICLKNTLTFGLIATLFIISIHPWCEKLLKQLGHKVVNWIFIIMLILFVLATIYSAK